ncbi:unnamed protein product [Allacma fusca]|uniref:Uncharacterized protein n=1 Tax=Allacma fusca TaxID=39272 RepID=A0A8J2L4W2_9HEXA|nr:unnamed protein product [Allacma fusca]
MRTKFFLGILGLLISATHNSVGGVEKSAHEIYEIRTTWDNQTVSTDDIVRLEFSSADNGLVIDISAPFYNDPKPSGNPGRQPGLWNYEVVEAFFLGPNNKYLELEFGPWGHYLALYLEGVHNVTNYDIPISHYTTSHSTTSSTWTGRAIIPSRFFPPGVNSFNAYSIHGVGKDRTYMSLFPVGFNTSANPDFHRLDRFQPINLSNFINVTTPMNP